MKYIVLLCDGMADRPVPELSGLTPMAKARKPHMDMLAKKSEVGLVKTVADGLKPGSDVANLSVLGYDPFPTSRNTTTRPFWTTAPVIFPPPTRESSSTPSSMNSTVRSSPFTPA